MKKRGFTLVELLAVIVILAIIAVIATPIILNVVKDTKKKAAIESFNGYMDAMEKTITIDAIRSESKLPKADSNGCYNLKELNEQIKIKGNKPTIDDKDTACLEKGRIKSISEIIIDGYKLEYKDNKVLINGEVVSDKSYVGIPKQDYARGDIVSYLGYNWKVIDDNGDSSKLILNRSLTQSELKDNLPDDINESVVSNNAVPMCLSTSSNKYCNSESGGYTWKTSIVKPTIENWLNNKLKENGLTKENELVEMSFSDGVETINDYIKIPNYNEAIYSKTVDAGTRTVVYDGEPFTFDYINGCSYSLLPNSGSLIASLDRSAPDSYIVFPNNTGDGYCASNPPTRYKCHNSQIIPIITVRER